MGNWKFMPMEKKQIQANGKKKYQPNGKKNKKKSCGDDDHLLLLPEDCFYKILVCLPVKSLLRFKSVCKSWRELIESSFFIDLHTTFNSSSSSKFGALVFPTDDYSHEIKMFILSSGDGDGDGDGDLGFLPFYKDYLLTNTVLRMVGSCNGVICLHDTDALDVDQGWTRQHYLNLRDVSLWNPATRQFRILPKSIPIEEKQEYMRNWLEDFIAFGFDVKTKDYKVLRITPWKKLEEGGCMCGVQVYSLSTDSWRLLEDIDSLPVVPEGDSFCNQRGIYLNGSYFFVGTKSLYGTSDSMMLSFDFTKEIFTTIMQQFPDDDNHSRRLNLGSSYLGEKLAVFTTTPILYTKSSCILSNEGEFSLISTRLESTVHLFNLLVTKEAKEDDDDFTIGDEEEFRVDVYKESLVSIMGTGNVLLRWQLPTHGTTYKLNLDAPFIDSYFRFGIGLCLTSDDTGGCIGVRSLKRYVRDAEEGEALAMLEAIKWAKKLDLSPIIIESDSKNCVSFFMDDDDDDDDDNNLTYWSSGALSFLKEAKLLLNSSTELGTRIYFQYCSRSCNYVSDLAAKLGREGFWAGKEWTANSPGEMVRSLSKDLGIEESGWGGRY